jgi:hypothetical protein
VYRISLKLILIFLLQEFDFNELENSTEYDGGFSRDTPCVRWFWDTVHGNFNDFITETIHSNYVNVIPCGVGIIEIDISQYRLLFGFSLLYTDRVPFE